ncbi:MAG: copper resistance protein CopC [Edaphobacter sp.]
MSHKFNYVKKTSSLNAAILLIAVLTFLPNPLHAQGCTQCLDNTASTPPATQRAYRHAIIILTLTAGGIFVGTLAVFKRHR